MRSIIYTQGLCICLAMMAFVCAAIATSEERYKNRRSDQFEVTSPKAGDTFAVSDYSNPARVSVQWTVPDSIADRNIYISLAQGPDVESLTLIEVVNASAPNNGSYNWYNDSYNSLYRTSSGSGGAPSGCNYSISLKSPVGEVFSPYFTIENIGDGGLARNATCPVAQGVLRPGNGTYDPTASQITVGASPTGSAGSSSTAPSDSRTASTFSVTTVAIAVTVPVVVLLLAFALVLWLALKRRWLVRPSRSPRKSGGLGAEKEPLAVISTGGVTHEAMASEFSSMHGRSEMYGGNKPSQVDGVEIHQLPTNEARR